MHYSIAIFTIIKHWKNKTWQKPKLPNRTLTMSILIIPLLAKHVIFPNTRLKFSWKRENSFTSRWVFAWVESYFTETGVSFWWVSGSVSFWWNSKHYLREGEGGVRFLGFRFFSPFPCPRECLFTRSCYTEPGVGKRVLEMACSCLFGGRWIIVTPNSD